MTLREKIESGKRIVTAELGPPQHAGADVVRKKAVHFRKGVDAVNVTDNQTAIVRMSSIATAAILSAQGVEPVVQMTCRDRNRIAIQSDLLGMAGLGLENVLCLTGDYPTFGNHPEARPVYDMDSIQLIAMAKRLSDGFFLSGEAVKTPPKLLVGGAANPFAEPFDARIMRLAKKIDAGAAFIQTQPVYDLKQFDKWLERVRAEGLDKRTAILAGVMPVKSANALIRMREDVPGMRIPDALIERMQKAAEPETEGIRIAVETIQALIKQEGLRGIHLMPLFWESVTPRILEESGLLTS
jgi:methylenetetrahydrofolate reductase (NADPH)